MQTKEHFVVYVPHHSNMVVVPSRQAAIKEIESLGIIEDKQRPDVGRWLEGDDTVMEVRDSIKTLIIRDTNGWDMAGIAPCIIRE